MSFGDIFADSVTDKSQADGAQTITLEGADRFRKHQIQIVPSATPSAGTLAVAIKTPGASAFVTLPDSIDMTDTDQHVMQFDGWAAEIRFTPSSFDAAKTYSVYLVSGAAS